MVNKLNYNGKGGKGRDGVGIKLGQRNERNKKFNEIMSQGLCRLKGLMK